MSNSKTKPLIPTTYKECPECGEKLLNYKYRFCRGSATLRVSCTKCEFVHEQPVEVPDVFTTKNK